MGGTPTLNGFIWNSKLWDGSQNAAVMYSDDTLVFYDTSEVGFSLSDGTTMIMTDLRISGPTREIIGGAVPRDHGEYVNADYFREYTIEASGIVKASTAALLDAQLDTIKKNLRHREGYLDYIDQNGTVKRFVATVDNYDDMFQKERYHITFCPWTVRFKCKTPFGKARSYTSSTTSVSTSPTNITVSQSGTIKAQPVIILVFDAANTVTVVNVKRINAAGTTLEEMEYSGSIATNDLLEFNSENRTVKKNGTAVDYTGSFIGLEPGSNILKFTVTATSFTALTTIKYKASYL